MTKHPTTGGRFERDPKTGALTRVIDTAPETPVTEQEAQAPLPDLPKAAPAPKPKGN